jgi:hypothetical protein
MLLLPRPGCLCLLTFLGFFIAGERQVAAQTVAANDSALNKGAPRTTNYRPSSPTPGTLLPGHPLTPVLQYARQEQAYLQQTVHDFTCRLAKRERIDGILQDYQYVDMRVREEIRDGDRLVRPLSIYLKFIGPASVAGRRVLFVEGQNDGKMLVRNGGRHFDYVVAQIDPDGRAAQAESLVPITQTGFNRVLRHMIEILERHAQADPSGENTKVERISGAKINHRPCNVVRILHPAKENGLEFHVANVFIDVELHLPVRVDFSDWPRRAGQPPPLLAEYTYSDLKLNVNLPDSAFDPAQLRGSR